MIIVGKNTYSGKHKKNENYLLVIIATKITSDQAWKHKDIPSKSPPMPSHQENHPKQSAMSPGPCVSRSTDD